MKKTMNKKETEELKRQECTGHACRPTLEQTVADHEDTSTPEQESDKQQPCHQRPRKPDLETIIDDFLCSVMARIRNNR